jgi:hypothetical protein
MAFYFSWLGNTIVAARENPKRRASLHSPTFRMSSHPAHFPRRERQFEMYTIYSKLQLLFAAPLHGMRQIP